MRAHAVLDLRKIRLTDGTLEFGFNRPDYFLLRKLAAESAEGALHGAQVAELFSESHNNLLYVYSNPRFVSRGYLRSLLLVARCWLLANYLLPIRIQTCRVSS